MATVKSGYLQKLGGMLKRDWKRRFFVLYQDGELVYYERPGSQISDGRINIRQTCQRIDYGYEAERDVQHKAGARLDCLFSIRSSMKNISLLADSEADAKDWVQKLRAMVQTSMLPGQAYPVHQPAYVPYPNNQPGMPYFTNQQTYPPNQPTPYPMNSPGVPYPPHPGMPQPYPVGTTYASQPVPYNQPMGQQPPPMYNQYPSYQTHPPPPSGYGYPAHQQQYHQAPQSRGNLSGRRGMLAGAAGGALAGGLLGFGMGHAVGGFGDSFDGDCCGFDCD